MSIPARWGGSTGRLVYVNEDGGMVMENAEGRTVMEVDEAARWPLLLQHPDGRWLPHGDVALIDAYWS